MTKNQKIEIMAAVAALILRFFYDRVAFKKIRIDEAPLSNEGSFFVYRAFQTFLISL